MSSLADDLAFQLTACGITGFERELRFAPPRRWRIDVAFPEARLAVECEGGTWVTGKSRHTTGKGYHADLEKYNQLTARGWRLLRFTRADIASGTAIRLIEQVLKGDAA